MKLNTKMSSGCRYERAVRQGINKHLGNTASINGIVAKIISKYSHSPAFKAGYRLCGPHRDYFIVSEVLSPHWVTGFFCPPRLEILSDLLTYCPDLRRRTRIRKKRMFHPFDNFCVRERSKHFHRVTKYEQIPDFDQIYA